MKKYYAIVFQGVLFIILPIILLVGCSKPRPATHQAEQVIIAEELTSVVDTVQMLEDETPEDYYRKSGNLPILMQSIVNNNAHMLASVSEFPIWRPYPEKEICNEKELTEYFNLYFDDSIKNVIRQSSLYDWSLSGWRGFKLHDGQYLWASEEGNLTLITYESTALKNERNNLYKDENIPAVDSTGWKPIECFLSYDSLLFVQLAHYHAAMRLTVLFRGDQHFYRKIVGYGSVEMQGSCHNEYYRFACNGIDGLITVWVSSSQCLVGESSYSISFPETSVSTNLYQDTTCYLYRAYWRDVKKWWHK